MPEVEAGRLIYEVEANSRMALEAFDDGLLVEAFVYLCEAHTVAGELGGQGTPLPGSVSKLLLRAVDKMEKYLTSSPLIV